MTLRPEPAVQTGRLLRTPSLDSPQAGRAAAIYAARGPCNGRCIGGHRKKSFDTELALQQQPLALLTRHQKFREHHVIAVFDGMDTAGKGGTIRRIAGALDAPLYRIIPIAAPTDEERAQPCLWRFWRHVPMKGRFTIYDRSWYGRVLVERAACHRQSVRK